MLVLRSLRSLCELGDVAAYGRQAGSAEHQLPLVPKLKPLWSVLTTTHSNSVDDSAASSTIMARIRLARWPSPRVTKAFWGTRQVKVDSKKIAQESMILSRHFYG